MRLVLQLLSEAGPFKPRHVAVWQGKAGESENRKEGLYGVFCNATLTHLGCIEVIHLDAEQQLLDSGFSLLKFSNYFQTMSYYQINFIRS